MDVLLPTTLPAPLPPHSDEDHVPAAWPHGMENPARARSSTARPPTPRPAKPFVLPRMTARIQFASSPSYLCTLACMITTSEAALHLNPLKTLVRTACPLSFTHTRLRQAHINRVDRMETRMCAHTARKKIRRTHTGRWRNVAPFINE